MASSFDDFNWASLVVPAVTSLLGHREIRKGNEEAANIAAGTAATNMAEIRAANERAAGTLAPISAQAAPALNYFRGVMARNPYDFTPQQRIELADRQRITKNQISPSLRGSARVQTAMANDVTNRGRAAMITENQRRSDDAASRLGTVGVGATTNQASIAAGQGPQLAGQNLIAGEAAGQAATGTAASSADTMGNIAAFFANAVKDRERESRYRRYAAGEV